MYELAEMVLSKHIYHISFSSLSASYGNMNKHSGTYLTIACLAQINFKVYEFSTSEHYLHLKTSAQYRLSFHEYSMDCVHCTRMSS